MAIDLPFLTFLLDNNLEMALLLLVCSYCDKNVVAGDLPVVISCASLALADAGIMMYDLIASVSVVCMHASIRKLFSTFHVMGSWGHSLLV